MTEQAKKPLPKNKRKSQSDSGDDEKYKAFGAGARALQSRNEIRERIGTILSEEDTTPETSIGYVSAIGSLLSAKTLTNEAKRLGLQTSGSKKDIIERLLQNDWAVPNDEDAIKAYLGKEAKEDDEETKEKKAHPETEGSSELEDDEDDVPKESASGSSQLLPKKVNEKKTKEIKVRESETESVHNLMLQMLQQSKDTIEALRTQVDITTTFIGLKQDEKDDMDNIGGLKKNVQKALQGKYVNLMHFWDKATATRRQELLGGRVSVREARDMDWSDWTLAMMQLADAYQAEDQGNLCTQIGNLLKAAFTESAIMTRQSVMNACEALRRHQTSPNARWGNDPLANSKHSRILLTRLTNLSQRKWIQRSPVKAKHNESTKEFQVDKRHICRIWWSGGDCQFSPCKFKHICYSCGNVRKHIPSRCSGAGPRQRS